MTDQIVSALQQSLRGRVIGRGDADYDGVRALYNGMIDKKPRVIARCVDVADVIGIGVDFRLDAIEAKSNAWHRGSGSIAACRRIS